MMNLSEQHFLLGERGAEQLLILPLAGDVLNLADEVEGETLLVPN